MHGKVNGNTSLQPTAFTKTINARGLDGKPVNDIARNTTHFAQETKEETELAPIIQEEQATPTIQEKQAAPTIQEEIQATPTLQEDLQATPTIQEKQATPTIQEEQQATPTIQEESQTTPTIQEESQTTPTIQEELQATPTIQEELQATSTIQEDLQATPTIQEDLQATPTIQEDLQAAPTIQEELQATPTIQEELQATPTIQEELQATPTFQEELQATPTIQEELQATPTIQEEQQATPTIQEELQATPTIQKEQQATPTIQEELQATPTIQEELQATPTIQEDQQATPTVSVSPGDTMATNDVIEEVVCDAADLQEGQMREVTVGDGRVLLVKDGDQIHALGAQCTHYGAPLAKGVLCKGRIRCPWHGACFSVATGDIEDFPGLDSLYKFEVSVAGGKVKVKASKKALSNFRRQKNMCRAKGDNSQSVLIIGGGPASVVCAQTLRQEGFTGTISIATKENHLPYERIKLSKAMDVKVSAITLRSEDFYTAADITILTQKQAEAVDTDKKSVTFTDGSSLSYGSLVIATGGTPRVLPIPGKDLGHVCMLRTPEDANFIAENAAGKNVVIIGSSFIGMEVTAFLADKAASISVVDIIKTPFQLVLGDKVGAILQQMHEERGVKFYLERGIKEFVGKNGDITEAVLSDGTRLPADLCVLGVGVVPATDFLKSSGITMNRGFVHVNKYMETDKPGVYAAGDIVEFPLFSVDNKSVNVQHWQMAHQHGRTAALSIIGKKQEIHSVPYFWTVMYGKSIRYTGYGVGYDDIVFHGDPSALKFVAYYTKGEEVVAVASLNFDPLVSQAAEFMAKGHKISKSEVQGEPDAWTSRLRNV